MMIFVVFGGIGLMIMGLARTYSLIPLGTYPSPGALAGLALNSLEQIPVIGLELAAPVLLAVIVGGCRLRHRRPRRPADERARARLAREGPARVRRDRRFTALRRPASRGRSQSHPFHVAPGVQPLTHMAEPGAERTEKATPKRRNKSRHEGRVAKSVEINSTSVLLVTLAALAIDAPRLLNSMEEIVRVGLARTATPDVVMSPAG